MSSVLHKPIMVGEVIENMKVEASGMYLDATYGRGGHSRALLNELDNEGRLICSDRDSDAICHAEETIGSDQRVKIYNYSFSDLVLKIKQHLDGILIDCGISTDQLKNNQRGFSFSNLGTLDMRMDQKHGEPVSQYINTAPYNEIRAVLRDYGQEKNAGYIAKEIVEQRKKTPITTTRQLVEIIHRSTRHHDWKHIATRTFQAFRILVNQELEQIKNIACSSIQMLKPHGRLLIITFHSLEVRAIRKGLRLIDSTYKYKQINKVITPTKAEINSNPSSRTAQLRIFEKCTT